MHSVHSFPLLRPRPENTFPLYPEYAKGGFDLPQSDNVQVQVWGRTHREYPQTFVLQTFGTFVNAKQNPDPGQNEAAVAIRGTLDDIRI